MQTFVPLPDVFQCAQVLDRQRLGKQRVEAFQILNTLRGVSSGWSHHPAVKMWSGHENALVWYGLSMCDEWIARGYKDNLYLKILAHYETREPLEMPSWWGGQIHSSHRSALLRKLPEHYEQYGWADDPDEPYFWPNTTSL